MLRKLFGFPPVPLARPARTDTRAFAARAEAPPCRRKPVLEALESRLLLSADPLGDAGADDDWLRIVGVTVTTEIIGGLGTDTFEWQHGDATWSTATTATPDWAPRSRCR